ncbi:hypothetical protein ACIQXD_29565 [Streptomyces uncialis]|uniref:hypothetical protein n=1 Tax=Streptomyces uncialis TaxID=1048205 RepID=UPI00382B0A41
MRITQTRDGEPVAVVTGGDLQIVADGLRAYVGTGTAPRRAVTVLVLLDAVAKTARRPEACICGSRDHQTPDCPDRPKRHLRSL